MKETRTKKPGRGDWAALCAAVMRAEFELERAEESDAASEAQRREALAGALACVEREPAYCWLAKQRGYLDALKAFARHVGAGDAERFEFLSVIAYAMEMSSAPAGPASAPPSARIVNAVLRHARELSRLIRSEGAGFDPDSGDAALLALLDRLTEHHERRARARRRAAADGEMQLRFGRDVAHLLLACCGSAPASVLRPLLSVVGSTVSRETIGVVLAAVRREARALEGAGTAGKSGALLDRIEIVPTRSPRRATRTSG